MRNFEKYFRGWKLGLGNTAAPVHYVEAGEMQKRSISHSGNETTMVWEGHEVLGDDFRVVAVWREINGRYEAEIQYDNYQGEEFIEEIIFPVLELDFSEDCEFIFCKDMGCRLKGETLFKPGSRQDIGFTAMQFCALINSGRGCYIDHRDAHGNIKYATVEISEDGKKLVYFPVYLQSLDGKPAERGGIPYATSVMEFTGSWFEAAVIYREWALKQSWCPNRTGVNPLRDIGMWIWNRGLAEDVMPPVERLQRDLPDIRMALDWYWWHQNPYDTDYPDFWPPREGEEHFRRSVERMVGQGIFTQVYVNGVCWDLDGPSWADGGEESIIIRRNREPDFNVFNKYNHHRLGMMCGEAPKFHDRISRLVKKLADCGLSGQYLDIIGGIPYEPCYNPAHDHGMGGGNHCVEGYRKMLRRLKNENPDFPLTTEYANEVYMDLLDGAIICGSTSQEHFYNPAKECIPLFSAVYHGHFALFGNYAHPDGIPPWDPLWPPEERWKNEKKWQELYPEQFFVEMARPVIWGAQPMVCNLKLSIMDNPEFAGIYAFIRHTAEFYYRNREFLFDGEMLSPDGFDCSSREVKFMMRTIFTKEDNFKENIRTMPSLLHSCWRDVNGNRALFIANYTTEEQKWSFKGKSGTAAPHSYAKIEL